MREPLLHPVVLLGKVFVTLWVLALDCGQRVQYRYGSYPTCGRKLTEERTPLSKGGRRRLLLPTALTLRHKRRKWIVRSKQEVVRRSVAPGCFCAE